MHVYVFIYTGPRQGGLLGSETRASEPVNITRLIPPAPAGQVFFLPPLHLHRTRSETTWHADRRKHASSRLRGQISAEIPLCSQSPTLSLSRQLSTFSSHGPKELSVYRDIVHSARAQAEERFGKKNSTSNSKRATFCLTTIDVLNRG